MTSMLAFTDGCCGTGSAAAGSEMFLKLASGAAVYGLLKAKAAYTPVSGECSPSSDGWMRFDDRPNSPRPNGKDLTIVHVQDVNADPGVE